MYLTGDPGVVPPNRVRYAENVRFRGGNIISRPGLVKFNQAGVIVNSTTSISPFDFQPLKRHRIIYVVPGPPPAVGLPVSGWTVNFFDQDQFQEAEYGMFLNNAVSQANYYQSPQVVVYNGTLYCGFNPAGGGSFFRAIALLTRSYSQQQLSGPFHNLFDNITVFATYNLLSFAVFNGLLFIGLESVANPTTQSKIVTYDGTSFKDDLTGIGSPVVLKPFRNLLVAGFLSGANAIQYRTTGSSPGTWTSVAPGAGTIQSYQMQSYKDILYITTAPAPFGGVGDGNIWSWTGPGGALAVAHNIAGTPLTKGLTVFNKLLYFAYETNISTGIVGKYDGTTWTDVERNVTADAGGSFNTIDKLVPYKQSLYAAVSTTLGAGTFMVSPGFTTSGTPWVAHAGIGSQNPVNMVVL
jgi:hypothetical protein